MARVAVVGAGIGGLGAALFLARRGHEVALVERDSDAPTGEPEADFEDWRRPGIPQGRQPHIFLGLAQRVLRDEAPEALDRLLAARPTLLPKSALLDVDPEPDDVLLNPIGARRMTFEPLLRALVEADSRIELVLGNGVEGLIPDGERAPGVPHVAGVRTDRDWIDADLVVDACGRRSNLPAWLSELDARPPVEQDQDLRFAYHTRWYRVPDGTAPPPAVWPPARQFGYGAIIGFPADRGVMGAVALLSISDPLRGRLREPDVFDRVVAESDVVMPWFDVGAEPITDVLLMARLANRARRLVDDHGPIVSGVVALGDAALYTNPTLGRGVSLALAHAQHLADTVQRATDDPVGYATAFDQWTEDNLRVWYDTQVMADGANLAAVEAYHRGEPPAGGGVNMMLALFEAAESDARVARGVAMFQNLLRPPGSLFGNPMVQSAIAAATSRLAAAAVVSPDALLPRAKFETLVGA